MRTLTVLIIASGVLGTVIGSFLNVCIYRIPAGLSIVSPGSHCPRCGEPIPRYQNIPVLSYVLLRGRCGQCRVPIAVRYPLVELLTGLIFILVSYRFGWQPFVPLLWGFCAMLVVITFIDLDHQLIPDKITLPGIPLCFLASFFIPWVSWTDSLLGIFAGGGSLLLIAWLYQVLAKKDGMGGGDIKLLAMLGAFLGWKAVLPVIFFGSVVGTIVGVPLMLLKKADGKLAIPFGPVLSLGALVYLLWGPPLVRWYLSLLHAG